MSQLCRMMHRVWWIIYTWTSRSRCLNFLMQLKHHSSTCVFDLSDDKVYRIPGHTRKLRSEWERLESKENQWPVQVKYRKGESEANERWFLLLNILKTFFQCTRYFKKSALPWNQLWHEVGVWKLSATGDLVHNLVLWLNFSAPITWTCRHLVLLCHQTG